LPTIIRKVLKINILRSENLPEIRVQTTKEAEPDFLKKVYTQDHPEGCILQIELEAKDDRDIDAKALYYVAAEYLKFRLPIDLRMIYLLKGRPKYIKGGVSFFGLKLAFPVYYLSEISYREFIYSDVPEEVLLGILADPEDLSGEQIVQMILERLVFLKGDSGSLSKFINQLKILSMLRNLHDETIKNVRNMVISEEFVKAIQKDDAFIMGEGVGLEKGLEEGKLLSAIVGVRNMTKKGFEVNVIAELLGISETLVNDIRKQLEKEAQILELLAKPRASMKSIAKKLGISHLLVQAIKESLSK
jgi:predicted transposase YdaD